MWDDEAIVLRMHSVIDSNCIMSLGGIWRPSEAVLGNKVHCLNQRRDPSNCDVLNLAKQCDGWSPES